MHVQHEGDDKRGSFFILENGSKSGWLNYVFAGETKFIIEHTEVQPGNEGRGLGKELVKAAIEFARAKELKIIPLCPYAKKLIEKTPEFQDVLF